MDGWTKRGEESRSTQKDEVEREDVVIVEMEEALMEPLQYWIAFDTRCSKISDMSMSMIFLVVSAK